MLKYNDEEFHKKLNTKRRLIPFKNGVYDLSNRTFRKIEREDYISKIFPYVYNPDIETKGIVEILRKILPSKGIRD